jgi:prepilin-type N-terminal cleavage/methylation domain-containing protein
MFIEGILIVKLMQALGNTNKKMSFHSIARTRQDGFSIIELCIVLLIASVLMGFALPNIREMSRGMDANKSMYQITDLLRSGRELAMAQRRRIEVQFPNNNQIRLVRHNLPDNTTDIVSTITLANTYAFRLFAIPDTPDGLGNAAALSFQDFDTISFLSDGSLVGTDNNPRSGTIFIGQANNPRTARAITIIGPTGRIHPYRWNGTEWIQ